MVNETVIATAIVIKNSDDAELKEYYLIIWN